MEHATEAKGVTPADLYKEYARMVYNVGLKGTHNRQAAEDITQQVFLGVFKSLEGFRNKCKLKTWIYQITLNECFQHRQKEWRERRKIQAYLDAKPEGREEEGAWDDKLLVGKILDLADPDTQRALEMMYYKDLTHEQIAEAFGVARVTITKRMERFKALASIRFGKG